MKIMSLVIFLVTALLCGEVLAEDLKLDACVGCHGLDGRSRDPDFPNLAGQKKNYLIKALKDFRIGERRHLMMNYVAKQMSDDDIEAYANHYSGYE
jgi:cytochrome c553